MNGGLGGSWIAMYVPLTDLYTVLLSVFFFFNWEDVGGLFPLPLEKTGVCQSGLFTL